MAQWLRGLAHGDGAPNALGRPPYSGVPRRYTPPSAVSVKYLYLHLTAKCLSCERCETSLSPLPPSVRNRLDGRSLRAVVRTPSVCRYAPDRTCHRTCGPSYCSDSRFPDRLVLYPYGFH